MIMMFTIIISKNIKAKPYLYEQSKLGCCYMFFYASMLGA